MDIVSIYFVSIYWWMLFFANTVKSHTIGVCTSRVGNCITIYCGTYHAVGNLLSGGVYITHSSESITKLYLFTSYEAAWDITNHHPPSCYDDAGILINDCTCGPITPTSCGQSNSIKFWQMLTVCDLDGGIYNYSLTSASPEEILSSCPSSSLSFEIPHSFTLSNDGDNKTYSYDLSASYLYDLKEQLEYSSESHPSTYGTKSTIRYEIEQIKMKLFAIESILAERHDQTIDELKQYLDVLHSRVQLRPTSAPTLSPTDPTYEPTTDPTNEPTQIPTTDPTQSPTIDPTDDPTTDPTIVPTNNPTVSPTPGPTMNPTETPTDDPTDCPTDEPTGVPTESPTQAPTTTWVEALTFGGSNNSYNGEMIDLESGVFNAIFQTSAYHIIQRECGTCSGQYKLLYYRRITNTSTFDAYSYMKSWSVDEQNVIFQDFFLFTSIASALTNNAADMWYTCDQLSTSVGGFGSCHRFPREHELCQYGLDADDVNFDPSDTCNKETKFSIFVGEPSYYNVTEAIPST